MAGKNDALVDTIVQAVAVLVNEERNTIDLALETRGELMDLHGRIDAGEIDSELVECLRAELAAIQAERQRPSLKVVGS